MAMRFEFRRQAAAGVPVEIDGRRYFARVAPLAMAKAVKRLMGSIERMEAAAALAAEGPGGADELAAAADCIDADGRLVLAVLFGADAADAIAGPEPLDLDGVVRLTSIAAAIQGSPEYRAAREADVADAAATADEG